MNYRHLIATACASAVIAGGVVAPATAHAHVDIDPLSRECKEATAAAKRGAPIPHMDRFVFSDNENALVENTLYLYAPDHLKKHIDRATAEWVKATNGLVRFEYVDKPGYKVVTVQEANLGGSVGRVTGNVHNMRVLINPDTIRGGHEPSITMTLAHEIGHAMGLAHSCDGALMKVGNNRGKSATTPQALDAQVLIQHNNLKQYGGRPPKPSTTAAPAPAPVEPTTSEPAPVVPEPSTPEVSTVVTTVPATTTTEEPTTEEPTTETTVIETVVVEEPTSAELAPEETTKVAPVEELPKPTTLQEALDAVKEAKHQYVAADEAVKAAQETGEGIDEAEAAADAAWSVLQTVQNNLEEFKAQHPDATLEPEPTQKPEPTSEVTTKPEVTTPRSTTTAKATTSAPTTTSTTSRTSTTSPTLRPTPTTQTQATKTTTTTKLSEVAPSSTTEKATTTKQATSSKETTVTTTPRTSAVTPSTTPRFSTKTSTTKATPTTVTRATKVTTTTKSSDVAPSSTPRLSTKTSTTKVTPTTKPSEAAPTTTAAATTVVEIPEESVVDKSTSATTTITDSLEIPTGKEDGSAKSSSTSPLAIIVPSILLVLTGLGAVGFYLYKHYF